MKTMFMFDLLTAKKMLKSQFVLSVVVAVIFGVSTDMPLAIIPFMALMLAYATGFTLVAYDERNDWERCASRCRCRAPTSSAAAMPRSRP